MNSSVVHVIDDDEAMRDSLAFLLDTSGLTARTYDSAVSFLDQLDAAEPGVIVTDVRMPEMNGLELVRRLKGRDVALPIIMITGHGDVPLAVEAMKAGAVDFIEKPFALEVILDSLDTALSRLAAPSEQDPTAAASEAKLALLSPREREVLEGLLAGLPNKTIAHDLAISPRTVEIHRARVMDKIGARSLSELVRLALAAGVRPNS